MSCICTRAVHGVLIASSIECDDKNNSHVRCWERESSEGVAEESDACKVFCGVNQVHTTRECIAASIPGAQFLHLQYKGFYMASTRSVVSAR